MSLTPLDIQQKRFGKSLRGYAPGEVETFLEAVAAELEDRVKENRELAEEMRRKDARLEELDGREKALHDALIFAQRVAKDLADGARKEAELVIAEARLQGERILADAQARRVQMIGEIDELKRQRAIFEAGIEGLIEGHRKLLDSCRDESSPAPTGEKITSLPMRGTANGTAG